MVDQSKCLLEIGFIETFFILLHLMFNNDILRKFQIQLIYHKF